MFENTTLCYIDSGTSYLMMHRTKKKNDINEGRWIGIGGHMEEKESPEDCILREAKEETGYDLTGLRFRGIITFVYRNITEYMCLFTASAAMDRLIPCDEGELKWIPKEEIRSLNLWEGDRIFLRLLEENVPFFSLKLVYGDNNELIQAVLDGKEVPKEDFI